MEIFPLLFMTDIAFFEFLSEGKVFFVDRGEFIFADDRGKVKYPRVAGSWIMDSFSMNYLREKYGMDAFCVCRDQWGTDCYTLWGGYFNQGYYPCKKNMLIPAQTKDEQIPVPVFRMLGSDPIEQYDAGCDEEYNMAKAQPVCTLEPVWPSGRCV